MAKEIAAMPYRITTVSSLDGTPNTKKFNSEAQAREVWQSVKRNGGSYYFGALFELKGRPRHEYSMTIDRLNTPAGV